MPSLTLQPRPAWPQALAEAIENAPMPPLGEGSRSSDRDAWAELADWVESNGHLAFSDPPVEPAMADACRSGLWLLAGELHRSHAISQDIASAEGSFWHGIMHRREGDFSNAKYWFRQVGMHPVFAAVGEQADRQGLTSRLSCFDQGALDPFAFVDLCQQAGAGDGEQAEPCRQLQWLEWQALFDHCTAKGWPA